MPQQDAPHPWQQIEEQAFHAFREWALWLVLRERELAQETRRPPSSAPAAEAADQTARQPQSN